MPRAVGLALLFFGFIAPMAVPFCAADCQMMQSSFAAGAASFDAAPLPCCAGGQTAVVPPMQVKPQAEYQTALDLHAPVSSILFHEPSFVPGPSPLHQRSLFLHSARAISILRI